MNSEKPDNIVKESIWPRIRSAVAYLVFLVILLCYFKPQLPFNQWTTISKLGVGLLVILVIVFACMFIKFGRLMMSKDVGTNPLLFKQDVDDVSKAIQFSRDQLKNEISELYLLNGFIFTVNSGLLIFSKDFKLEIFYLLGVFVSLLWFVILNKQKMYRDWWIKRLQKLQVSNNKKGWEDHPEPKEDSISYYIFDKFGLLNFLQLLPVAYFGVWVYLLFSKCVNFLHT